MKTVGLAATAAAGTAAVGSRGSAATVVNLGDEGLSSGDNIDQYIEDHFTNGNEVHVPAGEYEYTGAGLGGDKANCSLVGSPDGVTFNRPGTDAVIRPTLWATSGTVRIENITVKGKRGQEQSRWRVGAAEGATVEVVNVNMPDGTVDGSDSTGIYAGTDHAGTLKVQHCFFSDFGNVACYVSDPYVEGNGKVIVEDCDFVNTGMSALRLAPGDSEVRRCYFEATKKASSSHVGWNQRGIKIDDAGKNVVVEDCDFLWNDPGRTAIKFDDKGEGGTGVMRNLRIANRGDDPTFAQDWSVEGNWTGENIHLTGSGDHNAPSGFQTVTGSNAKKPNTEYKVWTPAGSQSGSGDGGSTDATTETATATAAATATATATADDGSGSGSETESTVQPIAVDGQTVVQAESGRMIGDSSVETYHEGYSGDGFVDPETPESGGVAWPLDVTSGGSYDVVITYSQGSSTARAADFVVNGERQQITFEPTGSWSTWSAMGVTATLQEGENEVRIEATGDDTGQIDSLEFVPVEGEPTPTPTDDGDGSTDATATPVDGGGSTDGGTADGGASSGDGSFDKVLVIDGTGDASETARYTFSVSGDVAWNEERSEVRDGGIAWDGMQDYVGEGRVVGVVGNAVDAYGFSGSVTGIDIRGKATFTIVRS